eukprot:CAMPEP_0175173276 /NCGR_PEP_ID=MMETSP0087-20121206/31952_1 /TAXON_ID=136419 /ORGANISM="Unknown Unknown, Strain D1" /LENGTH=382 /DNA_ID=CAMNT_0016464547 /DNA_START=59 /DNA_END=1207 /DNA_ORIENTATION=-
MTETVRNFLDPKDFYNELDENGMNFYTGVPDSLLKDYCAYVTDNAPAKNHIIAANEGCSVAIAAGYHLATRKIPVVYMQNSGFGNTVNPLLSLADPKVYKIPMLLLIGWRGEPGKKDEPQHMVQGKVMSSLLADMGIQFEVLPDYFEGAQEAIATAKQYMDSRRAPYALLVKRQTFEKYKLQTTIPNLHAMNREDAIKVILENTGIWDVIVGSTGFTSRELYEVRVALEQGHARDFLTVGSMGHATSIALGIATSKPSRQVITLDGDGACLMHMGAMAIPSAMECKNFKHILLNNGAHDSVGGQPTVGFSVDFQKIAAGCNYKWSKRVETAEDLATAVKEFREADGPAFLEVLIKGGARDDLGRPKSSPQKNKEDFMTFLDN